MTGVRNRSPQPRSRQGSTATRQAVLLSRGAESRWFCSFGADGPSRKWQWRNARHDTFPKSFLRPWLASRLSFCVLVGAHAHWHTGAHLYATVSGNLLANLRNGVLTSQTPQNLVEEFSLTDFVIWKTSGKP